MCSDENSTEFFLKPTSIGTHSSCTQRSPKKNKLKISELSTSVKVLVTENKSIQNNITLIAKTNQDILEIIRTSIFANHQSKLEKQKSKKLTNGPNQETGIPSIQPDIPPKKLSNVEQSHVVLIKPVDATQESKTNQSLWHC